MNYRRMGVWGCELAVRRERATRNSLLDRIHDNQGYMTLKEWVDEKVLEAEQDSESARGI